MVVGGVYLEEREREREIWVVEWEGQMDGEGRNGEREVRR